MALPSLLLLLVGDRSTQMTHPHIADHMRVNYQNRLDQHHYHYRTQVHIRHSECLCCGFSKKVKTSRLA